MMAARQLRIGDAERDAAVTTLGEHFAAGRLTKDEYDERADQVWAARYDADLEPVFADLPGEDRAVEARWVPGAPRPARDVRASGSRRSGLMLVPLKIIALGGLLFLIVSSAPWLLFLFVWISIVAGVGRARRRHHGHWHGHADIARAHRQRRGRVAY